MQHDEQEDNTIYHVVVNHEEQYSIWPAEREVPLGWKNAGFTGAKADCLAHIETVWTDMRPLSLRKRMAEAAQEFKSDQSTALTPDDTGADDLVHRLASEVSLVEVALRPEKSVAAFQESINRNFVHILFPQTRGGTELGIRLDLNASDLSQADFQAEAGTAHLVGGVTLNGIKVKCLADIELATLTGQGRLEIVSA